jgi:UDP-glucose 4-epimerase
MRGQSSGLYVERRKESTGLAEGAMGQHSKTLESASTNEVALLASNLLEETALRRRAAALDSLGDVLITGGAGFLGRYLANALATSGRRVTVLDDLSCSNSTFECPELQQERIRCIRGSVFNRRLVTKLIAEHKTVVHLASLVGVEETISRTKRTVENLKGTLNVVGALSPDHVGLFTSSADVYGAHSHFYDRAMREDDYFLFQNAKVNRWVYPHVKALEENLIANSPARSVIIRVFNTYGPAMDFPAPKRVIPHFIDRVLKRQSLCLSGDGHQRRSFCYVDDMIHGLLLALVHAAPQSTPYSECFNLGSPEPITMRDLGYKIVGIAQSLGLLDEPCPIRPNAFRYSQSFDDSWSRVPDIAHAEDILGFRPRVSLSDGLRFTLTYYANLIRPAQLRKAS